MAFARAAHSSFAFVASPTKPKNARGLWRRLLDALVESRRVAAEREVAWFLERDGGTFSDETEREIERILFSQTRL